MKTTISLFLFCTAVFAQRNAAIPDPDPEIERKSFIVAPGFEVSLFAADPLLAKPIQMNWDAKGRLWLATSEVYPQIKPGQAANDKIIILEDTDGDGKADSTEVFADGLLIPTAVLPGDGGAYVANSTEIIHLSASKPGQKADKRRVVLSGFGTEDTHHLIHTFRWGPDGAMYFNQSVYIHSHVETPHGTVRLNGGGIWRYEPRTQKLSVFARGFWNPWGLAFDKYGTLFATDGANGEGIVHVVPGASYPTGGNQAPRVLHGMNPGSPKHCGLEIVSGRHFPDDWQGDCITNDFRGHRVCRFKLRDAGSTFESREMTEVIKSTHPAFRPIDVSIGPDGALYIADWYNPIIQHGEVDFRDPRRDKTHGRIWRVTAKGRPLVERPKLTEINTDQLLKEMNNPEQWTSAQSRQLLYERDLINDNGYRTWRDDTKTVGNDELRNRLFFGLAGLPSLEHQAICDLPKCNDIALRGLASRLFVEFASNPGAQGAKNQHLGEVAHSLLNDASPRVRLNAIAELAKSNYPYHATVVLNTIRDNDDPTIQFIARHAMIQLAPHWIPQFKEGKFDYGNDMKKLAFALEAVQSPEAIPALVNMLHYGKVPVENLAQGWAMVARLGQEKDLSHAWSHVTETKNADIREAILLGLEHAARTRNVKPKLGDSPSSAVALRMFRSPSSRPVALRLVGLWKHEAGRDWLEGVASGREKTNPFDKSFKIEDRESAIAAIEGLTALGGPKSIAFLTDLANGIVSGGNTMPVADEHVGRAALVALVALDTSHAARIAAESLDRNSAYCADIVNAFVQRKNGAAVLAKAIDGVKLTPDTAKMALRVVKSAGVPSPALTEALTKAGNLGAAKKDPTTEEIKAFVSDAVKGDAARGELVFRRKELQCVACHAIGGAGGAVGPDLTSIGASAQPDYLVESLLLPNKAIKEGYHTVDVTTTSGRIYSGIKVREGGGEMVLRDKDDKEVTLKLEDIETKRNGRTLMPDGTTESLTRAELLDLLKFLGELGKVGAYEPSKVRWVRAWEVIEPTKENLDKFRRERVGHAASKPEDFTWSARTSLVSGTLPLADVPSFVVWKESGPQSVLRFRLRVSSAGDVKLSGNVEGLQAFRGSEAVDLSKPFACGVGDHVMTIVLDRGKRSEGLALSLDDASTARVSVVNGK